MLFHVPALKQVPRAGIVHRLDKDTTGLLVVAKTLTAQTSLVRQLQARTVDRRYLTLVQGQVHDNGLLETFYGRHTKNRLKMSVRDQGKEAITHYSVKDYFPGLTLLDIKLHTGRTHQIRVHMAYMNHPVVGDQLYGTRLRMPTDWDSQTRQLLMNFGRQALHAYKLSFIHPLTERKLTFEAPLADDFQMLLTDLARYHD